MISEDNVRVIITISKTLKEDLLKGPKKEHRSLSNYIATILQYTVEKDKI